MDTRLNYSGFVIAGVGFFLTRFTVTLAIYDDPVRFYLAGVVPLALGLGLAAFGVALAVADVERALVRTTAAWCVAGAGAMLVLVVLTLLGSTADMGMAAARSETYLANFLIGGSVGGTLTGLYAARPRRQRGELRQQANRLAVLNRKLRHEVLNALTAIRGYATLEDRGSEATAVIERRSTDIEQTIEEVKYLTRSAGTERVATGPVDVAAVIESCVSRVREEYPEAEISVAVDPETPAVRANDRLDQVVGNLVENAVVHAGDESAVEVSVEATATTVRISVRDEGPGLPESERALLEEGDIGSFDNPGTGFGLNVVRLLVEDYGGGVETAVDDGSTVTVTLPRASPEPLQLQRRSDLAGVRPATPHLVVTLVAAVLAGVVYGAVSIALGGSVAGIGVFYGTADPVIGWLTHEFHSVVFGFVFVSLLSLAPERYRGEAGTYVGIGAAWGVALWFVAAGLVAPVWLRLLDIPASIPNLTWPLLASHLVWGLALGALTAVGFERVVPRLWRDGE